MSTSASLSHRATDWWQRPAGGREVLTLALPMVVSAMSWTVMTFTDRAMLKHDSGDAMTAAFTAGALWFNLLTLPLGIAMYASVFVGQYHGAARHERIGLTIWQGVWLALLMSPVLMLAIPLAEPLFHAAGHSASVMPLEIEYFQILCWCSPALVLGQALSAFYSGRGKTSVVMLVDAAAALVNLLLAWAWIFGHLGLPAWGIAGAGWATVAATWLKAIAYFALFMLPRHREEYGTLRGCRFDVDLFKRLIYYGGPSALQLMIDVTGFTIFIMMVGRLGAVEAEATTMAFSISTLAFMPIWGFAQAASILVGQHLGENRDDLASRSTWTSLHVGLGYMAIISLLYLFVPDLFLGPFLASDASAQDRDQIYPLAIQLLQFVASYNLLDATAMIFVSALKGAGDTRFVFRVSIVLASTMALISWLGVTYWQFNIYACWALITGWVCAMGLAFLVRFLQGRWRTMRVIEAAPPGVDESLSAVGTSS